MEENNKRQDIELSAIKTDISWIKEKLTCVEKAIYNEIPHKIDELENKIIYGFIIGIISIVIIQIILKLFQ